MKKFALTALFMSCFSTLIFSGEKLNQTSNATTQKLVARYMMYEQAVKQLQYPINFSAREHYLKAYEALQQHYASKKNRPNKKGRERALRRRWTYEAERYTHDKPVPFKKFPFSGGLFS